MRFTTIATLSLIGTVIVSVSALSPPDKAAGSARADPSHLAGYSYGESCLFGGQQFGGFNPFLPNEDMRYGATESSMPHNSDDASVKNQRFSPEHTAPVAFVPKKSL